MMALLEFMPATLPVLRHLSSDPGAFADAHGIRLHELSQSVGAATLEHMKSFPYERRPAHLGYLVMEGESQQMVGICSFKGPPVDGIIEIAYFTFPGYE